MGTGQNIILVNFNDLPVYLKVFIPAIISEISVKKDLD